MISKVEQETNQLITESQILEKKLSLCKKETITFQQYVQNNEEIYTKLKNMYDNVGESIKDFHEHLSAVKAKYIDQKKVIPAWTNSISPKIANAQNNLKIKKDLLRATKLETLKYKKENACRERLIKEKKDRLNYLKEQNEQLEQRSEKLNLKIKENEEKNRILEENKKGLIELKRNSQQMKEDHKKQTELLQLKISEKTDR